MLGGLLTRVLVLALGYLYPAYKSFKAVDKPRLDAVELRNWCIYWIVLALFATAERWLDAVVYWFPLYQEAKLAFIVYLWHPKTNGADYVYVTLVRPKLHEHQATIDRHLHDWSTRSTEMLVHYWQLAFQFVQQQIVGLVAAAQQQQQRAGGAAPQGSSGYQGAYTRGMPRGPPLHLNHVE
eukprot:jgi/Chlat1/4917/Chrsp31S04831